MSYQYPQQPGYNQPLSKSEPTGRSKLNLALQISANS
jgi:hypothetical protein